MKLNQVFGDFTMSNKITKWVLLSDIHFNFQNYDSKKLRKSLIEYLGELSTEKSFDLLLIAGDICYKGQDNNNHLTSFFESIVAASKVNVDNVFMVPGNHDLKRTPLRNRLLDSIYQKHLPCEAADEIDKTTHELLSGDFEPFKSTHFSLTKKDHSQLTKNYIAPFNDINIVHINTAIFAGRDSEEGSLVLGQSSLFDTLSTLPAHTCNIAIGHHSIDCFNKDEQSRFISNLTNSNVDFYLCGHSHKPGVQFSIHNLKYFPSFVCGSIMLDGYAKACFLVGSIYDNEVHITYHSWNQEKEFWFLDNSISEELRSGELKFPLKKNRSLGFGQEIDEDDFKRFILNFNKFCNSISSPSDITTFVPKDVTDKFNKMKCSNSIRIQFDKFSIYFPLVTSILTNPSYISYEARLTVPNVIIEEYIKIYNDHSNGDSIIECLVDSIYMKYQSGLSINTSKIKFYIKILIYWTIHECDTFNEELKTNGLLPHKQI